MEGDEKMAMILVDGWRSRTPSSFSWGLQDVSGNDSGKNAGHDYAQKQNRTEEADITFHGQRRRRRRRQRFYRHLIRNILELLIRMR